MCWPRSLEVWVLIWLLWLVNQAQLSLVLAEFLFSPLSNGTNNICPVKLIGQLGIPVK